MQALDVGEAAHPASGDQRNLSGEAGFLEKLKASRDDAFEIKARVIQVGHLGCAEMAAGETRMLNHDRVGQALFALPFLHDQLDPAGIAEDGDQGYLRMLARQVGQVERQTGANDDGLDAAFQRLGDLRGIFADGTHHVQSHQAAPLRAFPGTGDLALERDQIDLVDQLLGHSAGAMALSPRHQVRMVPAQIDRAQRPHATGCSHGAR